MALMGQDKKVVDGKLRFILARGIGQAFVAEDVPGFAVLGQRLDLPAMIGLALIIAGGADHQPVLEIRGSLGARARSGWPSGARARSGWPSGATGALRLAIRRAGRAPAGHWAPGRGPACPPIHPAPAGPAHRRAGVPAPVCAGRCPPCPCSRGLCPRASVPGVRWGCARARQPAGRGRIGAFRSAGSGLR
jgi:hypothetical protein